MRGDIKRHKVAAVEVHSWMLQYEWEKAKRSYAMRRDNKPQVQPEIHQF